MLESMNPQEGSDRPNLGRDTARPDANRPLADREVPLPGAELGASPPAVHAWLDGEGTEGEARLADARQVALWSRINEETATRRRLTTPAHVSARIMDALPASAPALAAQTVARTATAVAAPAAAATGLITLSPFAAIAAAVALLALGFLAARVLG
jgi:hypothetical protein